MNEIYVICLVGGRAGQIRPRDNSTLACTQWWKFAEPTLNTQNHYPIFQQNIVFVVEDRYD